MNLLKDSHPTKDLKDFIKAIIETKSKEEEDNIIRRGIEGLKSGISQRNPSNAKMIEYCLRAIYSDMLGHNVSFSQVFAIKLIESKNIHVKRIGYLASALMLSSESELKMMAVATLKKDLLSKNELEVICALNSLNKLVNEPFVSAFVPCLIQLYESKNPYIKKKTLIAMQRIEHLCPASIPYFDDKIRQALLETDPSVVSAAVGVILEECTHKKDIYVPTIKPLCNILKQILDKKMIYYDYQKIPEPYLQLKILKIFSILASKDKTLSEDIYPIVEKCLSRADNLNTDVSFAVVYECILTITSIYYNKPLLNVASASVAKFLNPALSNSNTIHLGIMALNHLTQIDPNYLQEHQAFVINCIESNDDTIKRITLDLLCKNASPVNIETITSRLTRTLISTTELGFKKDLTRKIFELAVLQASDIKWFVTKFFDLLNSSSELFSNEMLNAGIKIFDEHFNDSFEFGDYLTEETLKLINGSVLHDNIVKIIAWVIGYVAIKVKGNDTFSLSKYYASLVYLIQLKLADEETKIWVLDSLQILSRQTEFSELVVLNEFLNVFPVSSCFEVQRKISEIKNPIFSEPLVGFCNPEFDSKLPFLLDFANSKKGKFYNSEISEKISGFRSQKTHLNELKFKNEDQPFQTSKTELKPLDVSLKNLKWTSSGYIPDKTEIPLSSISKSNSLFEKMEKRPQKQVEPEKQKISTQNLDLFAKNAETDLFSLSKQSNLVQINIPKTEADNYIDLDLFEQKHPTGKNHDPEFDFFDDNSDSKTENKNTFSISPLNIDENQYQDFWESFQFEKNGSINIKKSVKDFISLKNFHLVSQDEDDFITAAKNGNQVLLLYLTHVGSNNYDFIVKTQSSPTSSKLHAHIIS